MKISLIGTGLMGFPMAEKLVEAGHSLVVFNRTRAKAKPLLEKGVEIADSIQDALDAAEVIIFMLTDGPAIKELFYPLIPETDLQGKTIIQMGTILPEESLHLYYTVEQHRVQYVEAPVLGSVPNVKTKNLLVLGAAMEESLFERVKPVLSAFGEQVYYVGKIGQAAALKLALNQLIASLTAAFSVSLGIVQQRGISVELFMDILRNSALYAPTFDKKLDKMLTRDYTPANFPLKHLLKDMRLIKQETLGDHLNSALIDAVIDYLEESLRSGYAESDYSAIYQSIHREE